MGISRSTLNEWKKLYPDISDTLKRGKEVVDLQVENALLKRALGYRYTEDKYVSVPMEQEEYSQKLFEYMNRYKLEHPEATDDELMLVEVSQNKRNACGTKSKRSRAGYHSPDILVEEPKTG